MSIQLPTQLAWILAGLLALGWLAFYIALRAWRSARRQAKQARSRKRSQSTRYGQLTEQFAPWMEAWPFEDPEAFRFLGSPIDGIQFTEEGIYLVEIKAASSRLSAGQKRIREHVRAGRVGWVTFRVDDAREVERIPARSR